MSGYNLAVTYRNNDQWQAERRLQEITTTTRDGATLELINAVKLVWDLLADGIPPDWKDRDEYGKCPAQYITDEKAIKELEGEKPPEPRVQMWGLIKFDMGKLGIHAFSLNNINEYTYPSDVIERIKIIALSDIVDSEHSNIEQVKSTQQIYNDGAAHIDKHLGAQGNSNPRPAPQPNRVSTGANEETARLGGFNYKQIDTHYAPRVGQFVYFDVSAVERGVNNKGVPCVKFFSSYNGQPSQHEAFNLQIRDDQIDWVKDVETKSYLNDLTGRVDGDWQGLYKITSSVSKANGQTYINFNLIRLEGTAFEMQNSDYEGDNIPF